MIPCRHCGGYLVEATTAEEAREGIRSTRCTACGSRRIGREEVVVEITARTGETAARELERRSAAAEAMRPAPRDQDQGVAATAIEERCTAIAARVVHARYETRLGPPSSSLIMLLEGDVPWAIAQIRDTLQANDRLRTALMLALGHDGDTCPDCWDDLPRHTLGCSIASALAGGA